MGIQQTKSLLKTYYSKQHPKDQDDYLTKAFSPESLQLNEILENFWDTNASEYFDWTNIQENKKQEEIQKEKERLYIREKYILPELPLNPTITDNLFSIDTMSEFKEAHNASESKYFSNSFIKRMNIILIAYVKKILSTFNENSSLECITKYFESVQDEDQVSKVNLELGMNLLIRLLDDICDKNPKLKEDTLDFLMNNSLFIRPLAFWGETKKHFVLDKSLNDITNHLKKIIADKEEKPDNKYKAFKVLLNLGLAKGSLKNLLDFVDYFRYIDNYVDLNYEINLFKNEFIKLSLSLPVNENIKVKSKLWGFKTQSKKKEGEEAKSESISITNDVSYLYIFSSAGYIAKIGNGLNNTMLGKVYKIKEDYRVGENGTIACVENVLYFRSSSLDPNPIICISSDTLEEIPINYELNTKDVNSLWVESKKQDFEFPHTSYKDMNEIIEKKKNLGAEDKSNTRPTTRSPMTTDGRYIYIFSKWYDDVDVNLDKAVDDDDDEPKNTYKKTTISIYGVDIYDPLSNMSHVKSVKFNTNKKKEDEEKLDLIKSDTIFYTNGNIFVVDKFKFNLSTGEEEKVTESYIDGISQVSYDLYNNNIWGIKHKTENDKIEIFCFFNHSAKPIVEFPENNEKYIPCSIEKIIQHSEDLIKLNNLSNQISMKNFLRENTLNVLGLEDNASKNFKNQNIINDKDQHSLIIYKKSAQCLILSTIAKLSEYYGQVPDVRSANTDEERGRILSQSCRRPYCVKLEPETFEILINFINEFSHGFFNKCENKQIQTMDNYCLLSTIKILRTNLNCLSLSNLEIDFFVKDKNNNPFFKVKEFIFKIFEIYHSNTVDKESYDITHALYEECKIILAVSVNILYQDYYQIIEILENEIQNFRAKKYSKDIVKCILEWMSNEENMKNLLLKLKGDEIKRIFKIFEIVSSWEIEHFKNYITGVRSVSELPKFNCATDDEIIAFKFSSNMQIEILKSISKKLLNDNYEEIENEQVLHNFSEIIFGNVLQIFSNLRRFLEKLPETLERDWNVNNSTEPQEEMIDTTIPVVNKTDNKFGTLEEYKKKKYKEIWNYIIDRVISSELLIIRTFNFHIDCLAILSSSFIISSLMLNSYHNIIDEMNKIFNLLKECDMKEEKLETEEYKEMIFESEHPYPANQTKTITLEIPGEKELFIEFDPLCSLKQNCAYVNLFSDANMATYAFPQYVTLNNNFPKETLTWSNGPLYLYFYSDSCANNSNLWGYKVKIHNGKNNNYISLDNKFTSMMRSVCWVSCKSSAQLLRGNFTKSLTNVSDEDDAKYNAILNSKLFAGGIDFEDIVKDNDPILMNVINIFETIKPENEYISKNQKTSEKLMLNSIVQGDDKNINILLAIFQKRFSKEVVWAHLGGSQADSLVRAAFASLIRHSGQSNHFDTLLDIIEFSENEENEIAENDESLSEKVINHENYQSLYKKWQAASRMRTWLVEKKKNVDEALEKTKPKLKNADSEKEAAEKDENNSDEIMKKIIDQTIIKAKFLIKLNPSPAFSADDNKHDRTKNIFVRSSSIDFDSEDDWKRRLQQWKAVQRSKKVIKSVEDEANENLTSLTTSVLMTLQSTISSKRLFNKIKIASIRAKGREIGLLTMKNLFDRITHPNLIQDLLSWFCASLRKVDNKICHYLDNINGCGRHFEERVQESFQEFIILLINKLIKSDKPNELKSFIDALMWKYSANDHKFLVDHSVFLILWGTYNEAIKTAWGKQIKNTIEVSEDKKTKILESTEFTNGLLEIFEILSNICLDRATIQRSDKKNPHADKKPALNVNIKFPSLEKQVSIIDDSNSESLIRHILDVIFGEVMKSIQSYLRYRGISYNLWKQYEKYEEEKSDDKKKKAPTTAVAVNSPDNESDESVVHDVPVNDSPDSEGNPVENNNDEEGQTEEAKEEEEIKDNNEKHKKDKTKDDRANDKPYYYEPADLLNMYDEMRSIDNKKNKKTHISADELLNIINKQNEEIYDPEFLNRLLSILYKCSCQYTSDKILISMANPLNFSSLIKLMRICSTQNKILIAKILQNTCPNLPEEILIESVDLILQQSEGDKFIDEYAKRRKNFSQFDKFVFVDFIIEIIRDIREKVWSTDFESNGCYLVTSEFIILLRKLWYNENWNETINTLFDKLVEENDYLRKEIILSIFGADYFGQAFGAKIKVKSDDLKGLNFNFIKKDYIEHYNYGTIIGFSPNMDNLWSKKQTKDQKNKEKSNISVKLTPNNSLENSIGVLLHDSILKEDFNINDLTPKTFSQHEIMVTQEKINFDNFKIAKESIIPILSHSIYDKCSTSEALNLKATNFRFINNFVKDDKCLEELLTLDENYLYDTIYELLTIGNKQIQHKSNYLNLDILEEKRYRILNFCAESGYSLAEIPKISLSFRKPNYLIVRCSSENLLNVIYTVTGIIGYDNLCKFNEFYTFGTDGLNDIVLCEPCDISKYMSKRLIITHNTELKHFESGIKKNENTSIITIDSNAFNELIHIYTRLQSGIKLEEIDQFKQIIGNKPDIKNDSLVSELEEFGFSKDMIEKELLKTNDIDVNSLISNLIELKEKRKELEDKMDEHKVSERENEPEEDDVDNEPKNECFTTVDTENVKVVIPEYFEELIIGESEDYSLLYKTFKNINEKIVIIYARRIVLSILVKLLDENHKQSSKFENILNKIPTSMIVNLLKLLTHEGLFINSINFGSELLLNVKNILINIYSTQKSKKCEEIANTLKDSTINDLETVLNGKKINYEFITNNEEIVINKPMIFFSIWILMIMNEYSKANTQFSSIINILSGLITKINNNKQMRWFIIDLLIQLVYKIHSKLSDPEFVKTIASEGRLKDIDNIVKLRLFLDDSINKESKKNLSKRSQMICEFLIFLEEVSSKISASSGKTDDITKVNSLIESKAKSDNFVVDLFTTFEMMKDFFDKKYLKYLSWVEMNPDIVNFSKLTYESAHLYPKAPHTFLVNIPNTTAMEVNISSDTLLDNGDAVVFSLDKNCNYPLECYANRSSKKTFTIQSSHAFVHFPSNYLTEVYSFGTNTYTRLGQTGSEVFTPKLIESLSSVVVKDIAIGDTFVMVLTNNGDLLSCGNGSAAGLKSTSNTFTKAIGINSAEKINSEGISLIGVNNGSTIIVTKDYSHYSIGVNSYGQLGQAWTSPVLDITNMNFQKKIKQISVCDTHSILVTNDGQVYHIGNNDYYQNGELSTNRNNTPKLCILNKNLSCEMVSTGEYYTIFLMKDILTGKKKLYASGWSKLGRTGTGKDEETHGFKAISTPDLENVEFRFITSSKLSSAAISTNNKLYMWGNNPKGQLGLGHYNDVLEPTLVTFFDKYEIEDVALSVDHTLVIVKDIEKNKISVFGFGDHSGGKLGETVSIKSEKKDTIPTPIRVNFFEGKNPCKLYAGTRASIVMCKVKPYENLRDVHNINCSKCQKQINKNLFAEFNKELKVYCADCDNMNEARLIIKAPLMEYNIICENIKKHPNILLADNIEDVIVNCKQCKEDVSNTIFMYLENKQKFYLCLNCFDKFPSCVTSAKVYVRYNKPLKNIDIANVHDYYDNSISYGHKFTITPVLNEKGCETVIEKHQNSFNNFVEDINENNKFEVYEQLVDLLNDTAQKAERSIYTYQPKELLFKKEELSVRNSLEKCNSDLLRKLFVILKIINNKVKELLPFIDFSKVLNDNQRLSFYFNKITPLIFWDTKNELIKYYLEKTASEYETTEIKINRLKVRKFIEKGKPDHTGEFTIWGNIFQFIKSKSFKIFKKKEGGNNGKLFNVTFVGEASIDAGGPYREAITQAMGELQSSAVPLFIPSPNQKNESGLFREKWVVNPSSKSTTHLEMYKVFGGFIGYAIRTGEFLNLDLPSIFWKQLLEVPLERKDLESIDRYTIQCLDDIINIHKKGVTAETFSFYVDQKFTTCLSDGEEVEVIEGGKDIDLTYSDRVRYCEMVEKIRLEESKIQMAAIRSGLE